MLSTRLNTLIVNLGLKKGDFAEKIGFTQAYISMILSGKKTNPSSRFYDAVAYEFNVNADWLRDGVGEMFSFPGQDVSASDAALLAKYRLLPSAERKVVDEVVDAMLLKSLAKEDGLQ